MAKPMTHGNGLMTSRNEQGVLEILEPKPKTVLRRNGVAIETPVKQETAKPKQTIDELLSASPQGAVAQISDDGQRLIISLPIEPYASDSGKSIVIATTRGNRVLTSYKGRDVAIGVNAFIKK